MLDRCSYSDGVSVNDLRITPRAVNNKLKELNTNKAQGPDKIPPYVLNEIRNELSLPLCVLFNKSIESGFLPEDWKTAEVTAIFKKGNKSDPGNYRPVSLTCILCKVLESLIRDVIVTYFTENNLYANCQHGFRKKRSCVTQLLEVMEDITSLMDSGHSVDVIYMDFRKAFDTVPHRRLLIKLEAYGISGNILKWIDNFLTARFQYVRVGEKTSQKTQVLSGIPQGSILGPVLFTIFINDLPNDLQSTCRIFADDTKIFNKTENCHVIQEDIFRLQEWSKKWDLHFNISKCGVLNIGKNNCMHNYSMKSDGNNVKLKSVKEEKDLGVTFDCKLSFDPHIQGIIGKANQTLGLVKRSFTYLDKDVFLKLYKAFIRPHLEYANAVWNPFLKRQSIQIEKIQRRATKGLKDCKDLSYAERLKYLNLYSLKGRRIRGDLIQTYKIFNKVDNIEFEKFFALTNNKTRNNEYKIYIRHCKTNKRKFSFAYRVANLWNALPTNVKLAQTTNQFKNHLDGSATFKKLFYDFD